MAKVRNIGLECLLGAALLVVPIFPATSFAADSTTTSTAAATASADEATLRAQAEDYAKAYSSGDAKTIANMWTADGTYTDEDGLALKGRANIEQYFASGFKQFGAQPLEIVVQSISFPASNVAIEEGTSRVLKGHTAGNMCRYTVVHIKDNGQWLMAAVNESAVAAPETSSKSMKDLAWLIGHWTAKGPGGSLHFDADWLGDGKVMQCTYTLSDASSAKSKQLQVIGWSPRLRQITSWSFGSKGGFDRGRWLKDGQSFVVSTSGMEPDGTASSSIQTFHKLSDNSFTWCSTDRVLDKDHLADTPEITVTRDQ